MSGGPTVGRLVVHNANSSRTSTPSPSSSASSPNMYTATMDFKEDDSPLRPSLTSQNSLKMRASGSRGGKAKPYSRRQRTTSESSTETELQIKTEKDDALHRCTTCGKVYKHESCLLKHNWEHTEYWELAKQHCASKHQSVQLLEAARILLRLS